VEERMVLVMDMLEVKEHEFSAKVVSWYYRMCRGRMIGAEIW
jgi:hypothetical protein